MRTVQKRDDGHGRSVTRSWGQEESRKTGTGSLLELVRVSAIDLNRVRTSAIDRESGSGIEIGSRAIDISWGTASGSGMGPWT